MDRQAMDVARDEGGGFVAEEADRGERLDRFLVARSAEGLSRTRIKALIEAGAVTVDGAPAVDAGHLLKPGQAVRLTVPEPVPAEPAGEAIALHVVYEDSELLVVDKPAGLVVHPAGGNESG